MMESMMTDTTELQRLAESVAERISSQECLAFIERSLDQISSATAKIEEQRRINHSALQEPYTL